MKPSFTLVSLICIASSLSQYQGQFGNYYPQQAVYQQYQFSPQANHLSPGYNPIPPVNINTGPSPNDVSGLSTRQPTENAPESGVRNLNSPEEGNGNQWFSQNPPNQYPASPYMSDMLTGFENPAEQKAANQNEEEKEGVEMPLPQPFRNPEFMAYQPPQTPFRPPLPPFSAPPVAAPEDFSPPAPGDDSCTAYNGRVGSCVSAGECISSGGEEAGWCGRVSYYSPPLTCCTQPSCGGTSSNQIAAFRNPDYPAASHQADASDDSCDFQLWLAPGVCQVKVELLDLTLARPRRGLCDLANSLQISSSLPYAFLPLDTLCGELSGSHVYLHLGDVSKDRPELARPNSPPASVTFRVRGSGTWNIRLTQVMCGVGSTLEAPPGCGQYFSAPEGRISSLNFAGGSSFAGQSLATCLKAPPGACATQYLLHFLGVDKLKQGGKLGYGLACSDYLSFYGQKTAFCGSTQDKRMVFTTTGRDGFTLNTDDNFKGKEEVGFDLSYRFLEQCDNVKYYKFPFPAEKPKINP